MYQQITIQTSDAKRLKPLLNSVLGYAVDDVKNGIRLTRAKLKAFEKQYNLSTAEFERRFKPGDLEESLDFIEWQGEIKTLSLLEEKYEVLKEAKVK